ncbi:MAG: hypothetical protein ABFD82_05000 [Syntrophaceae bacterium]
MEKYTGGLDGHRPWIMTQNQRGPTCGLTAITVAYRILTGWTIFATKGQYRDFMHEVKSVDVKKGDENAYVLRKAALDKGYTAAGEIVNADDLAELVNMCDGIRATVRVIDKALPSIMGDNFVKAVREDIGKGIVPIVLFYVKTPPPEPDRKGLFQHWVPLFAVEDKNKWLSLKVKNTTVQPPLILKTGPTKKNQMLMWNWGNPWLIDGEALGISSALSLDWTTTPRMWDKRAGIDGELGWKEINPSEGDYKLDVKDKKVRYTKREKIRDLEERGYVQCML